MLNYIWGGMIIIGIVVAVATGSVEAANDAVLDSAGEAVQLCITMLGVVAVWTGLMEVARESGLIKKLTKKIMPALHLLFPDVPMEHEAMEYISLNMISNFLGLGWAATPAGIRAMELLSELGSRKDENEGKPRKATRDMCTFLIINVSSLQLIPVNIIAFRSKYGSVHPASILVPAIIATTVSTIVGIVYSVVAGRLHKE